MKNIILIPLSALTLAVVTSCNKSEIVKAEEQRYEAAIDAIDAERDQKVAYEKGNHKIALTLAEVETLRAKADQEAKKAVKSSADSASAEIKKAELEAEEKAAEAKVAAATNPQSEVK